MTVFTVLSPTCQIHSLNEIYDAYFSGLTHGVFVEVGGNDGYSWSNTWGLAEIGWRGIYYEPVHDLAQKCRQRHAANNVTVIEMAVGQFDGEARLYSGQGATTSEYVARFDVFGYGNNQGKYTVVPACSLNTSLKEQRIPHRFELLVIDVDGDEPGILMGLDLAVWRPQMVIIETSKHHPTVGWRFNADKIDVLLSEYYREIYSDTINSIYIRKENGGIMASLFEIKRDLILKIAGWYGCQILVETGTGAGDTVAALRPYFEQVHSIELSRSMYQDALNRFRNNGDVRLYQGDSGKILAQVLPLLDRPSLIYLDAHFSGGHTAKGAKDTPILEELRLILTDPKFRHIILIDDLDQFGKGDYPKVDVLKDYANGLRKGLKFEALADGKGMILIVPTRAKAVLTRKLERKVSQPIPIPIPEIPSDSDKHRWERAPILYGPYRNPKGG